jgi:hypothetical protein
LFEWLWKASGSHYCRHTTWRMSEGLLAGWDNIVNELQYTKKP